MAHRLSGYAFSTANRFWIKQQALIAELPPAAIDRDRLSRKETTMDNLIALFREQAAVLAAYGQGGMPARGADRACAAANPAVDATAIVRAEVARVSGFPERSLRPAQTIAGDLGFDSIMVADLFSGITRKIPGVHGPAGFRPTRRSPT